MSYMSGFLSLFIPLPSLFDVPGHLVQVFAELRLYLQGLALLHCRKVMDGCVTSKM